MKGSSRPLSRLPDLGFLCNQWRDNAAMSLTVDVVTNLEEQIKIHKSRDSNMSLPFKNSVWFEFSYLFCSTKSLSIENNYSPELLLQGG